MMSKARKERLAYVEAHRKELAEACIGEKVRKNVLITEPTIGPYGRRRKAFHPLPIDIPPECIGTVIGIAEEPVPHRSPLESSAKSYQLMIQWGPPVNKVMPMSYAARVTCLLRVEAGPQPPVHPGRGW